MKHIAITLGVCCLLATSLFGQVKSKFQDKDYKNRTVVIKDSEEVDDLDILNSQFDIDEFKVGEEVRITTGRKDSPSQGAPKTVLKETKRERKLQMKKFSGSAVNFKKKKKRKTVFVYDQINKKERRKRLREKCYRF